MSFLIGHNKNIILKAKDVSFFEKSQSLSLSSPVLVQNKGNVFTKKKKKKRNVFTFLPLRSGERDEWNGKWDSLNHIIWHFSRFLDGGFMI